MKIGFCYLLTFVVIFSAPLWSVAGSKSSFQCALYYSNNLDLTHYAQFSISEF